MQSTFDYIVVGAGSAGCVLANRLSQNPEVSVCLVEAGGSDKSPLVSVPAGILALYGNPKYDYGYVGTPQSELNNRSIPVNRGKALGGSSTINSMVYIRGAASDYDEWADLGCDGWAYKDVLPVFKQLERNRLGQSAEYHGFNGELFVDAPKDPNVLTEYFIAGAQDVGLPHNTDFNGASQFGVGVYNVTQNNGERYSSFSAFLRPVEDRANLTIMANVTVDKLVIDGTRVIGLDVTSAGKPQRISCSKEVILSSGAINSPALLLASGIGPAAELDALGVSCKVDLPGVGKNLRDHIDGMVTVRSKSSKTLGLSLQNLPSMLAAPFRYLISRKGMFSTNYVEAGGFAKTRLSDCRPDIQFHFVPGYRSHRGRLVEYGHGYAVHTCVLRPKSIGEIRLKPSGAGFSIEIDNRFFSDPEDVKTLIEGIKFARSIFASDAFAGIRGAEMLPGNEVQTDAEIVDYLRSEALTVYHPVGTCKMGVDNMAVVSPQSLKVYGLDNLRVADASIMPTLIAGNTSAPSMMIGQRAADMILSASGNNR